MKDGIRRKFKDEIISDLSGALLKTLQWSFNQVFPDNTEVKQISFAISEPNAGSDLSKLTTQYDPISDKLTGLKMWIGLSEQTTHLMILARTPDQEYKSILIPVNSPGIEIVERFRFQGFHFEATTIRFTEVSVVTNGKVLPGDKVYQLLDHTRQMVGIISEVIIGQLYHFAYNYACNRIVDTGHLIDSPIIINRLNLIGQIIETLKLLNQTSSSGQVDTLVVKIISSEWTSLVADLVQQMIGARAFRTDQSLNAIILSSRFLRIGEGPTEVLMMQLGNLVLLNQLTSKQLTNTSSEAHQRFQLYIIGYHYLLDYISSLIPGQQLIKMWIQQQRLYLQFIELESSDPIPPEYSISHLTKDPLFQHPLIKDNNSTIPTWLIPLVKLDSLTHQIDSSNQSNATPDSKTVILAAIIICQRLNNYTGRINPVISSIDPDTTLGQLMEIITTDEISIDGITFPLNMGSKYRQIPQYEMLQVMIDNLSIIISSLDPAIKIKDIEIVTKSQKRQYLEEQPYNYTYTSFMEAWDNTVANYPDNNALVGQDITGSVVTITYHQLDRLSNRMANYLLSNRNPSVSYQRIGLISQHRIELIIGILAVYKIGGAFLPIAHGLPVNRIIDMCRKSQVNLIIMDRDLQFNFEGITTIHFPQLSDHIGSNRPIPLYQGQEAYITFTSGTTGAPKGVVNTQVAMVQYLEWLMKELKLDAKLRVLHTASIGFDIFTMEVFTPLMCGGTLIMAGIDINRWDPTVIVGLIDRYDATMLVMAPPQIGSLINDSDQAKTIGKVLTKINYIYTGGAPMPKDLCHHISIQYPDIKLIGFYGVTEVSNSGTVYFYPSGQSNNNNYGVPIGQVFGGKRLVILDDNLQIVPPGLPGQMVFVGFGVANGYLNDPGKSAEKFIIWNGLSVYLTGDKGYMEDSRSNYRYCKRMDRQAKINGVRFEPEELEVLVMTQLSIQMVAVTVQDNCVHLYLINSTDHDDGTVIVAIRKILSNNVPTTFQPTYYHVVETMPLSANGKIDYNKLIDQNHPVFQLTDTVSESMDMDDRYQPLKQIWESVTGKPVINNNIRFIQSGGNSMRFAALAIKVFNSYKVEIYSRFSDGNPTFYDLIQLISTTGEQPDQTNQITDHHMATPSQLNLYLAESMIESPIDPYLIMHGWIVDRIDLNRLESVIIRIEGNSPWLKSTFRYDAGTNQLFYRDPQNINPKFAIESITVPDSTDPIELVESYRTYRFDLTGASRLYRIIVASHRSKYIVIFMTHHILVDGIGLQHWFRQIYQGYNGDSIETVSQWSPGQYSDWFSSHYNSSNDIHYWKSQPAAEHPIIPGDVSSSRHVDMPVSGTATAQRRYIPPDILKQLHHYIITGGFTRLLTSYLILLNRHHPDQTLSIAFPVHGRYNAMVDQTIGNFTNTLVLSNQIDPAKTIREMEQGIRTYLSEMMQHQQLPYHLRPNKTDYLGYFSFFGKELPQYSPFIDQSGQEILYDTGSAKSNLSVFLVESVNGLTGFVEFMSTKYSTRFIDQLLNNWTQLTGLSDDTIINTIAFNQDQIIGMVKPIKPAVVPPNLTITEAINQMSQQYPDNIAIRMNDIQLSYLDLELLATRLAKYITTKSIPNRRIAILTDRTIDQLISAYAILKVGTYVPINPEYPDSRIKYILEDAEVSFILVDATTVSRIQHLSIDYMLIDNLNDQFGTGSQRYDDQISLPEITPSDICYIIYTSGTTGNPKGVMVTHLNVMYMTYNTAVAICNSKPGTVYSYFHSIAFDFSVFEVWSPLSIGGQVVVVDYATTRNTDQFYQLVKKMKVNVLSQTPSAFYMFTQIDRERQLTLPDLHCVVFGGEALRPPLLKEWTQRHAVGSPRLINMYGITEITVHATYHELDQFDINSANLNGCIGRPLWDGPMYICYSDSLKLVPPYTPGEILVAGYGVAVGYLNLTDLTNKKFIDHPVYGNVYRSGDFAYYDWSGQLYYIGRRDDQVKIRGYRIELGDIIAQISKSDGVKAVHVGVRKLDQDRTVLVAYIAHINYPQVSSEQLTSQLLEFLDGKLAGYMIPSYFLYFEELPLNPSGKVDHRKLADISIQTESEVQADIPTTSSNQLDVKDILKQVWTQVLQYNKPISDTDNFYRLGGDSMAAIRISAILREKHGIHMKSSDINKYPTISGILPYIESNREQSTLEPFGLLTEQERLHITTQMEDMYPVTQLQLGLLYNIAARPDRDLYVDIFLFQWLLSYDKARIEQTIHYLTNRFRSIRTTFRIDLPRPLQLVYKPGTINISISYLEVKDDSNTDQIYQRAQAIRRDRSSFNNSQDSLFKFLIVQYTNQPDRFGLVVIFCHALCEGWSAMVLARTFQEYYLTPPTVIPLDNLFNHYVAKELQAIQNPRHLDFWSNYLNGFQYCRLPSHKSVGMTAELNRGRIDIRLSPDICTIVLKICQQYNLNVKTIFMYMYIRWLSLQTGQLDITTSTVINNRLELSGCDDTIGLYLSTLPIRLRLSGIFLDDIARLSQDLTLIEDHKMLPLDLIMQSLTKGHLLFETAFNYISFPFYRQSPYTGGVIQYDATEFSHSLTVLKLTDQEIYLKFDFDLDTSTIDVQQRMAQWMEHQISLIGNCHDPSILAIIPNSISTVSDQIRYDFPERYFYDQFTSLVEQYPGQVAIMTDQGDTITFAQLYNYVAHTVAYLTQTYPAGRIVVWDGESSDSVIALYSCLFSGLIYLPVGGRDQLNPNWPRIQVIKNDYLTNLPYIPVNPISYMIYTSGTTAIPKLVQIPPRALYYSLINRINYYNYTTECPIKFLCTSSSGYDSSLVGLFMPLMGQTVVFSNNRSIDNILEQGQSVDMGLFTPSLYQAVISTSIERKYPAICRSVVILAGEDVPQQLVNLHKQHNSTSSLYNEYGPTECCIWALVARLDDQINIGHPLKHMTVKIMSDDLMECQRGQLVLSGPQMMINYYPDQHPITEYSTGDLVIQYSHHGQTSIKWLGRLDRRFKRHGTFIDSEEIETIIRTYLNYSETRVYYHNDLIVAVIRGNPTNDIETTLQKYLHPIMLPNKYIYTDGSVERIDLDQVVKGDQINKSYTITTLLSTWRQVLNNPYLVPSDNLKIMGATSLAYMRVAALMDYPIDQLIKYHTVNDQIQMLGDKVIKPISIVQQIKTGLNSANIGIIAVHPVSGYDRCYHQFTELQFPGPIYSIKSPKLFNSTFEISSLHDLAKYYLQQCQTILSSQNIDKWILLGWSFGGLVCMEMAKLIQDKIHSIYLLDTINPTNILEVLEQASPIAENIAAIHRPILSWHLKLSPTYRFTDLNLPITLIKARSDPNFSITMKRLLYRNNWNLCNLTMEWLDIGHYEMLDSGSGIMDLLNLLLKSGNLSP